MPIGGLGDRPPRLPRPADAAEHATRRPRPRAGLVKGVPSPGRCPTCNVKSSLRGSAVIRPADWEAGLQNSMLFWGSKLFLGADRLRRVAETICIVSDRTQDASHRWHRI